MRGLEHKGGWPSDENGDLRAAQEERGFLTLSFSGMQSSRHLVSEGVPPTVERERFGFFG
jgi:hypothetical protein